MRVRYYDIVKGYAIVLVVLGHVIQNFFVNWDSYVLELFIYSFHMPLFITISGRFFIPSVDKRNIGTFIKDKFISIQIPSLTIGCLNCAIVGGGGKLLKHSCLQIGTAIEIITTGLWFLTVLFILEIIGCLFRKILKEKMWVAWLLLFIVLYFSPNFWLLKEMKYLMPFFVLGIYARKLEWKTIPFWAFAILCICFVLLFQHFDFSKTMYRMSGNVFSRTYLLDFLFRDAIAICGIGISLYLCSLFGKTRHISKALTYLGGITLPIYVLHQKLFLPNFFLNIQLDSLWIILLITVLTIIISVLLYKLLRKSSICNLLLFGSCKKS